MEYRIPPGTEAVEKLEDFIVVNRLAPNTRIPSERDLCEMWGVSRTTLRQAVDTLVGRGVLYRVNGAGVYVSVGKKNRNMVGVDSMVGELRQQGSILAKKIISVRKVEATKQCLLSKLKTLDFTDFCPIFWYNDCKDFDKNKSFFLQFSYRF